MKLMQMKVLHQCHKLAYFWLAGWKLEWIETVCEIIEQEYEQNYKNLDVTEGHPLCKISYILLLVDIYLCFI